jgi:hypothetical protein
VACYALVKGPPTRLSPSEGGEKDHREAA